MNCFMNYFIPGDNEIMNGEGFCRFYPFISCTTESLPFIFGSSGLLYATYQLLTNDHSSMIKTIVFAVGFFFIGFIQAFTSCLRELHLRKRLSIEDNTRRLYESRYINKKKDEILLIDDYNRLVEKIKTLANKNEILVDENKKVIMENENLKTWGGPLENENARLTNNSDREEVIEIGE